MRGHSSAATTAAGERDPATAFSFVAEREWRKGNRERLSCYASYVTLQDFTIQASVQHESAGNLINWVHGSYLTIRNVHFGSCYYHPLEIDQSKQILVENCRFFGANTGISGSRIQLDYGAAGPTNRPAGITTRTVEDLTVQNCVFEERTAGESASARDIELTHNGTELVLNRVTFRGCHFTGRNEQSVSIVDIGGANSGGAVKELLFERCTFVTTHPKSYAFYMAQSGGMTFRGIRFRQCEFTGPSAIFLVAGGSVTSTYSATHSLRHEGEVTGCRFILDKTQMPVSTDLNLIIAVAWSSFRFDNNYIECNGDFPVSVGLNYSRLGLFTNSLWTEVTNNRIVWNGNATFGVNRLALLVDVATPDNAGTTQGVIFEGNRFFSAAGTGWSYGLFIQRGTTYPGTSAARRGLAVLTTTCRAVKAILARLGLTQAAIRFHRDDPKTTKTCPGKKVTKAQFLELLAV